MSMTYTPTRAEKVIELGMDMISPRFLIRLAIGVAAFVAPIVLVGAAANGKHPYITGHSYISRGTASPLEKR